MALEPGAAQGVSRWYLVRHAQPLIAKGICYGRLDVQADEAATQQAAAAFAAHWRAARAGRDTAVRVQVSPLLRCQQFAQAWQRELARCAQTQPVCMHMRTDAGLSEIDFGSWEGVAWNDVPPEAWQGWQADFANYRPGGGESVAQVLQRVQEAVRRTLRWLRRKPNAVAVWITHAGVMRSLHWLQRHGSAPPASAAQWPLDGACPCGQWLAVDEAAIRALAAVSPQWE